MPNSKIKSILGVCRLKFTRDKIAKYLYILDYQNYHKLNLLDIYNNPDIKIYFDGCYSNFCRNLSNISKLIQYILQQFNLQQKIEKTEHYIIADTTLVINKKPENILKSDWDKNNVTARDKNKHKSHKVYYCGYKLLCFLNKDNLCYGNYILNINYSDSNILKDSSFYKGKIEYTKLLVDRGLSSKLVYNRLETFKCECISPKRKKQQKNSDDWIEEKHKELYKKRFKIEVVFNKIKNMYKGIKLDLTYKKASIILQKAKIYLAILKYNLITLGVLKQKIPTLSFT